MGDSSGNFDTPSVSQADMLKQEAPDVPQANQYSFPSSTANYAFENTQQLNASFANSQASSQMQGLPLSGVMVRILQVLLHRPLVFFTIKNKISVCLSILQFDVAYGYCKFYSCNGQVYCKFERGSGFRYCIVNYTAPET